MVNLKSCLLLNVCLAVGATSRCPPGSVQGVQSSDCYIFQSSDKSTSWHVAQGICAAKGGSLASIGGPFDNALLSGVANSVGPAKEAFWLGGYRNESLKQWRWLDGSAFEFTNWANTADAQGQNSCLAIGTPAGEWQATSCEAVKPFVCKIRPCQAPPATVDGKCLEGWTYIEAARKCFKALPGSADWKTAYASCKLLDAEMVTISTGAENTAITDFLASKSVSSAAIGMRNAADVKYEDGGSSRGFDVVSAVQVWIWVDGTYPFYKNWAGQGPASGIGNKGADCAFLDVAHGGTWYNEVCSGSETPLLHDDDTLATPVCQTEPLVA